MAMAEVIVLRSTGSTGPTGSAGSAGDAAPEREVPGRDVGPRGAAVTGGPLEERQGEPVEGRGSEAASAPPAASGPAAWLPRLLGGAQEEATEDDGVHRYRGARVLYTSGCRYLEVSGSPSDPTTVRLTVVWGDEAPAPDQRRAFLSWWTTQAAGAGWEPAESDDVVGSVEVVRYLPSDAGPDEQAAPPVRVHSWEPPPSPSEGARTSGRRT